MSSLKWKAAASKLTKITKNDDLWALCFDWLKNEVGVIPPNHRLL